MHTFLSRGRLLTRSAMVSVANISSSVAIAMAASATLHALAADQPQAIHINGETTPEAVVTTIREGMTVASDSSALIPIYRKGAHCMYIDADAFNARIETPASPSMKEAAIGFLEGARKPDSAEPFVAPVLANLDDLPEKLIDRGTAFRQLVSQIDECGTSNPMVSTN